MCSRPPSAFNDGRDIAASLLTSLTSPITVTLGDNASSPLSLFSIGAWVITNYASGTSVFSVGDVQFDSTFQLSPWDPGTGYSQLTFTDFELTIPSFDLYGVQLGETIISLDTETVSPTPPTGLVEPVGGEFHLFLPIGIENPHLPPGGISGLWVSVFGTLANGQMKFDGIHFAEPGRCSTYELGIELTEISKDIVAAMPTAEFASAASKNQLLAQFDGFRTHLEQIGDDQDLLMGVGSYVKTNIIPLVDGPIGGSTNDDVLLQAPQSTNEARGLAYFTAFVLDFYFERYYNVPS